MLSSSLSAPLFNIGSASRGLKWFFKMDRMQSRREQLTEGGMGMGMGMGVKEQPLLLCSKVSYLRYIIESSPEVPAEPLTPHSLPYC